MNQYGICFFLHIVFLSSIIEPIGIIYNIIKSREWEPRISHV